MKLVMLIVDEAKKEEVEVFLQRAGVAGYTELPHALGTGTTGQRLGSRAYPKTSAVIFTVVEAPVVDRLVAEIKAYCGDCGERLKIVVWSVEEVL
jgi:nitrogen regulatory protein PII